MGVMNYVSEDFGVPSRKFTLLSCCATVKEVPKGLRIPTCLLSWKGPLERD